MISLEEPPFALIAPLLCLDALFEPGLENDPHGEDGCAADLGSGLEVGEAATITLHTVEPGHAQVPTFS